MTWPRVQLASVAFLLAACSQTTVDTSAPPSQSASPPVPSTGSSPVSITPTDTPAATASPSASSVLAWSEVEFSGVVNGVVAFGGGYVAVGTIDRVPTAWTSADGETWEPHVVAYDPPDGDLPGMPGPWMGNLAEHDGWLYAIGGYQGGGDGIIPLGWRSQDGRSWEQIASQSPFYTDGYLVQGLVSGTPGLLALTTGYADGTGGVWLWTAADSWLEVTDALPGTSGGADFSDAVWADGRYVVVGYGTGGDGREAAAWTSTDGRSWEMNGEPYPWESNQDPLGVVTAVAPAPGGGWSAFLMAPGRAVGLYSADARSWEVTQDLIGTWAGHIWSVAIVGDRLIAVGGLDSASEGAWVLTSSDGRTWGESHRADDAGALRLYAGTGPTIASNGSSVLAVLSRLDPDSNRVSVLLRASLP